MDLPQGDKKFWLTLLLRGDKSSVDRPVDEYVEAFRGAGLSAVTVPILEFEYIQIDKLRSLLQNSQSSESRDKSGLIITSPRVVNALDLALRDLKEHGIEPESLFDERFVFVVGDRTAKELKCKLGLKCNEGSVATGSGKALSSYIREYCDNIADRSQLNMIYPKGNLADDALESALENTGFILNSVVVYETMASKSLASDIIDTVKNLNIPPAADHLMINYAFFSPSGVEAFRKIDSQVYTDQLRQSLPNISVQFLYSAIGKTTENALRQNQFEVFSVASMPNATSLLEALKDKIFLR